MKNRYFATSAFSTSFILPLHNKHSSRGKRTELKTHIKDEHEHRAPETPEERGGHD